MSQRKVPKNLCKMNKDLTLKNILLDFASEEDIEKVFLNLIFTGQLPDNEETKKALEITKKIPQFLGTWKNLEK